MTRQTDGLLRAEEEVFSDTKCPVCFWWNDIVQNLDPNFEGGENEMSLNEYRKNWLEGKPVR